MKQLLTGVVLGLTLAATIGVVFSQTQTQRFPQFENSDVKVWRSLVMPGTPLAMHRHEHPRVIIALKAAR